MNKRIIALAGATLVLAALASSAHAGVIEIPGLLTLEHKATIQLQVPQTVFTSHMHIKLVSGWGDRDGEEYTRPNGETTIWVDFGKPIDVYNLYPAQIHVPQPGGQADPNAPNSFFDVFFTVDSPTHTVPFELSQASITDGFGVHHPGTITPINNLNQLPTFDSNDTQVVWDLSVLNGIAPTTGDFYLVKYVMTGNEVAGVPEPSTLALWSLFGIVGGFVAWRKRRN